MAVESKHVNASLRMTNPDRYNALTLQRVRPGIESAQVTLIADAVREVTGGAVGSVAMTVTTELVEA